MMKIKKLFKRLWCLFTFHGLNNYFNIVRFFNVERSSDVGLEKCACCGKCQLVYFNLDGTTSTISLTPEKENFYIEQHEKYEAERCKKQLEKLESLALK